MRVTLQGFVSGNKWMTFDEVLFTGRGGKANMSWEARNIPPVPSGVLPKECWIRDPETKVYSKLVNFSPSIFLSAPGIYDLFRIVAVYDGIPKIYNPEIKVYEKPYTFSNFTGDTDFIEVPLGDKFINYTDPGDILEIKGNFYIVDRFEDSPSYRRYYLDSVVSLESGDLIINISDRFDTSDSEIIFLYDIPRSPYRFKWGNNTSGFISPSSDRTVLLLNDDKNTVIDLLGDDRVAVFAKDWNFEKSAVLVEDIGSIDTTMRISNTSGLEKGDYITLFHNQADYEIVLVEDILSTSEVLVRRAQLETAADAHTSGTDLYFCTKEKFSIISWTPPDPEAPVRLLLHVRIETSYL